MSTQAEVTLPVRIIAVVWILLAIAAAWAAASLVIIGLTPHPGCSDCYLGQILAIFAAVFLVVGVIVPVGLMSRGVLRGSPRSTVALGIYSGLAAGICAFYARIIVPMAQQAIADYHIHGPHWGGYPEYPIQAGITVGLLAFALVSSVLLFVSIRAAKPGRADSRHEGSPP